MARQPFVTRTVSSYQCLVLCVNPESQEMTDELVKVSARYKEDKDIIKAIEKANILGGKKPLYIKGKTVKHELVKMYEEKFIAEADFVEEIDPKDAPVEE